MFEIIFGLIAAFTQLFNERILAYIHPHRIKLISFAAGLSSSYLFLLLFPEVYNGFLFLRQYSFLLLFLGFITIFLVEKYIYKHVNKKELNKDIKIVHHSAFFLYHFIAGIIFIGLLKQTFREGLLFFLPIWFHISISSVALTEIHRNLKENSITKIILSASMLLGIIFALCFMISTTVYYSLLSIITGALTFIVVKDFTPNGKEINLRMFILGILFYSLTIILTKFL